MAVSRRRAAGLLAASCTLLLGAAVAAAQDQSVSPSVRFEKGLAFLKEHELTLVVELAPKDGGSPVRQTVTAYYEMVQMANKKLDTTVLLVRASGEEIKVATIRGPEVPSKGLGAWLWYKVCAAASKLDSCRDAGVIS